MKEGSSGKLLKNTFYLYLVTVVKLVAPLITLPYLTRVLSVSAYGTVSFVKAYCTYVMLFIDFGFLLSATKNIVQCKNDAAKIGVIGGDTIVEKTILTAIALAATIPLCFIMPILKSNIAFTLLYFSSCAATIGIIDFLYRGIEKMEYVAIPFTLSKIIVILLTFILIKSDDSLLLMPVLELTGNITAAIVSIAFLRSLGIKLSISGEETWIRDLKDSGVYFLSNFATTFFGALTTIFVGLFMSSTEVAIWSVSMMVVSAVKAMYSPISNSLYPHMIVTKDLKLINRVAGYLTIPLVIGCTIIVIYGEPIMAVFASEKYIESAKVLVYLIPVFVFSLYSMLYGWPVLGSINKRNETTATTAIAALVQLIGLISLVCLNAFNLYSLAICCGLSEAILLITRLIILIRNRHMFSKSNQ